MILKILLKLVVDKTAFEKGGMNIFKQQFSNDVTVLIHKNFFGSNSDFILIDREKKVEKSFKTIFQIMIDTGNHRYVN